MFGCWTKKIWLYVKMRPAGMWKLHSTCPKNQVKDHWTLWNNFSFLLVSHNELKLFNQLSKLFNQGHQNCILRVWRNLVKKIISFWNFSFPYNFRTRSEKISAFCQNIREKLEVFFNFRKVSGKYLALCQLNFVGAVKNAFYVSGRTILKRWFLLEDFFFYYIRISI